MKNRRKKYLIIALSIVVVFIFAGTYAYWNWTSSENKNVAFNTSNNLKDYITYDDGESKFVGDFQVSDSYLDGVHTTISMKKSSEATNVSLMATINMDINAIGETMKVGPALKWVVTSGDSTNVGSILSSGNFVGTNAGDTMVLLPNIEVLETVQKFTIWIWIDSSENPSADLTGETLDTVVWTQIDQVEGVVSTFSITKKNATYQTINATVVNNMNKIVSYAVTTSNTEPSTWTSISDTDQSNVYNLEYSVSTTGTYYIWFKDSLGNVVSDNVSVSEIDTSAPVCIFEDFNPSSVANGETATVDLVCMDNDLKNINLSISDIEITGSSAILSNISKVKTTNGYTYTISLVGTENDGTVYLTLPSGKIFDSMNNANESVSSGNLIIQNDTEAPVGTITTSIDGENGIATLNATDDKSGLSGSYNWKISTSDVCDSSTTGFTTSTSLTYTYTISSSGNYYVCAKFSDNAGNIGYAKTLAASSYIDYSYTGNYQTYTVPVDGYYQVETWGAQGNTSGSATSGLGSKTIGTLHLTFGEKIYVYVGGYESTSSGGYNGGGYTNPVASTGYKGVQGGGATDVRYFGSSAPSSSDLTWNSILGLNSRIMVAAGGGGAEWAGSVGGNGGGLTGGNGVGVNSYNDSTPNSQYVAKGGTQTAGGTAYAINDYSWTGEFGTGGYTTDAIDGGGMGGGGYYGGGSMNVAHGGGGGSSFISGYAGVNAITSSSDRTHVNNTLHYSNKYFVNGKMISGNNSGNGKAKITYIGTNGPSRINSKLDNVRYIKDCINGNSVNIYNHWIEVQAIYQGQNIAKGIIATGITNKDTHPLTLITDGIMDTESYAEGTDNSGEQCITLDLGSTYDLDEIAVWHYYHDGRTYNDNITYVSSDNATWKNAITLVESETSDGKRVSAYEGDTTDDYAPTGTLSLSNSGFNVIANVSASDVGSGVKEYQYLIQSDASCPSSGYTSSTNSSYNFTISSSGTYYVCVRIKDNVGNVSEPISESINIYEVSFDGNMFIMDTNKTSAGVTLTYDPNTSYLTLNGTPTDNVVLTYFLNQTFVEGEQYKTTLKYISGDYTNSSFGCFSLEMLDSSYKILSTRNYQATSLPLSDSANSTMTINSSGSASGNILKVWFWFSTPSDWTFNDYKIKVDITKVQTKYLSNGQTYGTLPTATRIGYTFDGWYTDFSGGTKISSTTTFNNSANQTLYAHWVDAIPPTLSYSLAGGTYASTQSVTVTASDTGGSGFDWMHVHVYKDGTKIESKSQNSITTSSFNVSLDSEGTWTIYAQTYDKAGNKQNQTPNSGDWYYQTYTISTTKNGAYFVNNRSNIANLSSSLVGGMYRFQGSASAVTNNYICFGTSNKSTCTGSPDYWMYRIIGVTSDGMIKVIKKTPLGGGSGNTYQWHNSLSYALWSSCSLYSNLNGSSFLTNTTYLPSGWSDKIASTTWYFRSDTKPYGSTYMAYTGADMYTYETSDASLTAKIGLISLHDYYLAPGNGVSCSTKGSCSSSWIQLSNAAEWTMARRGKVNGSYYAIGIRSEGYATSDSSPFTTYYIVRPVFYISSSVSMTGTGTISDPYIIK